MYKAMYMTQTWRSYKPRKSISLSTVQFFGNLALMLTHSSVLFVSYKISGVQMFGEIWFYAAHVITFYAVRLILSILKSRAV
jgi:hypothetical protein